MKSPEGMYLPGKESTQYILILSLGPPVGFFYPFIFFIFQIIISVVSPELGGSEEKSCIGCGNYFFHIFLGNKGMFESKGWLTDKS